jgi:transcriptional regulator with XRE-family HTH domain
MARKNTEEELLEEITEEITEKNCAEKLDLICQVAGISLKELAKLLGENPATLSHIKRSAKNPKSGRTPTPRFMDKLRTLASIRPKGLRTGIPTEQKLTTAAVAAGLSALARTELLGSAAVVAGTLLGGIAGGLVSFGMLHAVDAICKKAGLSYKESEGNVEITKEADE